ncbi:outer membrane protein assembly factor BamA [Prosthecomicrobium sp. N25]|uniref:outer membrane protein assembly factor BamA n=1 Tax=Prosthecomicrobium sp. N25 TaxID=3129254 RepID=UPI00307765B4
MRAFSTGIKKTVVVAAFVSLVPVGGTGFDFIGVSIAKAQSSIVVRGNQRVEAETVRSYMTNRGRAMTAQDIDESLKALYGTGLFSDVQIQPSGGQVIVTVKESPLINRISFEGNKRLTDEQLKSVVESKVRGFLSRSKVQSDVQRLLEAYRRNGRFRATIEPKIIELSDNRVDLVFEFDEGDKTAVSRITFVGNNAFSDGRLRDVIKTRETGLLGFIRTTDTYDPDRLTQDQEAIRKHYTKNGYADFRILSASADLDRERNIFFVTFTVDEGELYTFGQIDVQSTLPELDPARLRSVVRTSPGGTYNAEEIEKSMEAIVAEASKLGYAFAQVRPRAVRDYGNKTIAITYYIDEGPRAYVERINVRGNSRTRDYVVRREIDIAEGDAFNRTYVTQAERRLNRLGFFKSVKLTTEPGSSPDRVVLNVDVEEQSTGELGFGAGYSTAEGIIGDVSLSERNFLGRGQFIKVAAQFGEYQKGYSFSFTEPYFLGYRLSAGIDLYTTHYEDNFYRAYSEDAQGATVRFGFPITDNLTLGTSYSIMSQDIMLSRSQVNQDYRDGEASLAYKQFIAGGKKNATIFNPCPGGSNCHRYTVTSMPSANVVYNSLDNIQFPRDGIYVKFQTDFAGLGGDVSYVRATFDSRYYREIYADWGLIGMLRLRGGHIEGVGEPVDLINNFFLGGETIRGFAAAGIGPRDITRITPGGHKNSYRINEALGGRTYVAATAEMMRPFPFTPEEFGLYTGVFADAGTLFNLDDNLPREGRPIRDSKGKIVGRFSYTDTAAIRSSAGFSLLWRSPFGPLRADFGFALTKAKGDQEQVFRFSGGTQF